MSQSLITLYDIPGNSPTPSTWSPNVWRVRQPRYVLAIKGLAFDTVWVEYPDIAATMKHIGVENTEYRDGAPLYTVPVIHDALTGATVADSLEIAAYLDTQYPDTPRLFSGPAQALQRAFIAQFVEPRLRLPTAKLVAPYVPGKLSQRSGEYFRATRVKMYGMRLEELSGAPEQRVELVQEILGALKDLGIWLDASKRDYLGGDNVSYADVVVASNFKWLRAILGDDGDSEWKAIRAFEDGRWERYIQSFEKWEEVPVQ
ncbi:hypothetical protein BC834DRAFT_971970 [Gloeopeniophorella convolvens]|nr:hypothetical protein BC834DRAFT_971970 [Gloeopeniophorella convolvens]